VFRRRRRDSQQDTGVEPGAGDYPAADDELAEQDSTDEQWAEVGWTEDEWTEDEATGEPAEEELAEDQWVQDAPRDLSDTGDDGPGSATATAGGRQRADLGDPATWTRLRDSQIVSPAMTRSAGPWDGAGDYPEAERIDFGSLLVPVREGFDVQVFVSEEDGISIAVVNGDSGLQLQPFAAPRSSGL
jgi:hypothetical protein